MNKKYISYIIIGAVLILGIFGVFSKRFDLTQEKRYTLSESTIKILESVKKPLTVDVYLEGDFPASFRQLQNETKFMLEEFRKINPKIDYKFIDYPNALHAFTNPDATAIGKKFNLPIAYNKEADEKSWNEMKSFLAEIFK